MLAGMGLTHRSDRFAAHVRFIGPQQRGWGILTPRKQSARAIIHILSTAR